MSDGKRMNLAQLNTGKGGVVVEIQGGHGLSSRLGALGIREGKRITKVSSMVMRGPVTVQVGRSQVAIGFGMAKKVLIELD